MNNTNLPKVDNNNTIPQGKYNASEITEQSLESQGLIQGLGGTPASSSKGAFTVTIANPAVVSLSSHGFSTGDTVILSTTIALPTGLSNLGAYFVIYKDANSFWLATTYANAIAGIKITTSGSQSGVHSLFYNQTASLLNPILATISTKAPIASPTFTGTVGGITATMIGLGSVTNDAQVKKASSSTNNMIPKWSGTTGDVIVDGYAVGTSANNLVQLDSSAKLPAVDGSQLTNLTVGANSEIHGLSFTNNGSTPNTAMNIGPGDCYDSLIASKMTLSSIFYGSTGGTWQSGAGTSGSPKNKLDTGTVAINTTYHVYVIGGASATTDIIFSTNASSPSLTIPGATYTYYRNAGSFMTDGSGYIYAGVWFREGNNLRFEFKTTQNSIYNTQISGTQANYSILVPSGFECLIYGNLNAGFGTSNDLTLSIAIGHPSKTLSVSSNTVALNSTDFTGSAGAFSGSSSFVPYIGRILCKTNTSQQVALLKNNQGYYGSGYYTTFWQEGYVQILI